MSLTRIENSDIGSSTLFDQPVLFIGSEFTRIKIGVSTNTLSVPPFTTRIGNNPYSFVASTLSASDLDTGSFPTDSAADYYIWAGLLSGVPSIKISLSKTTPLGLTDPIMIGGFHYGVIRNSVTATDVTKDRILSTSIWTRKRGAMPSCYLLGLETPSTFDCSGMVEFSPGKWGDIYLVSDPVGLPSGGSATNRAPGSKRGYSRYGVVPLTGTEGLNAYDFMDRAQAVGKRLLTVNEWTMIANGAPAGVDANNTQGWTATSNTTRVLTGALTALSLPSGYTAISAGDSNYRLARGTSLVGARDTTGNLWEWVDGGLSSWGASGAWRNVLDTGESSSLLDFGQEYSGGNSVLPIMGGNWNHSVVAGSRALSLSNYPWIVSTGIGSRFACDSL